MASRRARGKSKPVPLSFAGLKLNRGMRFGEGEGLGVRSRDCRLGRTRKDKHHNPPPPKSPSLSTITSGGYKTCGPKRGTSGMIPPSSRRARRDFAIAYLRPLCGGDLLPAIYDAVLAPVPHLETGTASTAERTEALDLGNNPTQPTEVRTETSKNYSSPSPKFLTIISKSFGPTSPSLSQSALPVPPN